MKAQIIFCTLIISIIFCCLSCDHDPGQYNPQIVIDEIEAHDIEVTGEPTVDLISIPDDLNELSDEGWGIRASACEEGGYDLYSYAGENAYLTVYSTTEICNGLTVEVCVLSNENNCICAFKDDQSVPGIVSIDEVCQ